GVLHEVHAAAKLARFLVLCHRGADPRGRVEGGHAGAARTHAFRKRSLRYQLEVDLALENHLLQQLVLADVCTDVLANLTCRKQQSHSEAVHPGIVADGGEVLDTFLDHRADQVLRNPAQPKSAHHDAGAVEDIAHRLVGISHQFVHKTAILHRSSH